MLLLSLAPHVPEIVNPLSWFLQEDSCCTQSVYKMNKKKGSKLYSITTLHCLLHDLVFLSLDKKMSVAKPFAFLNIVFLAVGKQKVMLQEARVRRLFIKDE